MLQKILNNKEYYNKDGIWYLTDKNGKPFKVINKTTLEELNKENVGLGDMVAKITQFFGIEPCESCQKRKEAWNNLKLFPHLRKDVRALTEVELILMERIQSKPIIENDDVNSLFTLYNDIFKTKLQRCNCPGLVRTIIGRVQTIINIQTNNIE